MEPLVNPGREPDPDILFSILPSRKERTGQPCSTPCDPVHVPCIPPLFLAPDKHFATSPSQQPSRVGRMISGCQTELLRLEDCHAHKITWLWKMTGLGFQPRSETDSRDGAPCLSAMPRGQATFPTKGRGRQTAFFRDAQIWCKKSM